MSKQPSGTEGHVRFGYVANPFSLPVAVALERGFFASGGVEIELTRYPNGSVVSSELASGKIDIGVSGHLQTLTAVLEGSRQLFVCPLGFERSPNELPIALLGSDAVVSGRDLEGAAIAVSSVAAISELQLRIYLAAHDVEYRTVRLVEMPFAEMKGAFVDQTVTAASVPDPLAQMLVREGLAHVIDRGSLSSALAVGARIMVAGIATTTEFANRAPDLVAAFVDAVGKASDELAADRTFAITSLMRPMPGVEVDRATLHLPLYDPTLVPSDLQLVYDVALSCGLVDTAIDAADLIWDRPTP